MEYKLLSKIKSPDDVKKLNYDEISLLCQEIRDCIVSTVSKNGGHLASNLGAVELTVALHRSFSSPEDALIFDVGHQSYTHKLLTGRFDRFSSIRTENGLSGYMRPDESEHDPFITGHSSNSISAAYGIYRAKKLKGEEGTAVAVIGDGAMTGGMAYEALNNAGSGRSNFIVVLNDNKMSISRNVGALARSLTKMRNKPHYHHFKFALSRFLLAIPLIGRPLNNAIFTVKEAVKELVYHENIFSALGFNYLGPVDGHDVKAMEQLFDIAKSYSRPSVIHVITTKGKGYAYAESSPKDYHGVSAFDIDKGAKFGGKRTTALYFEPAFFALALISIWLSIKQFGIKTPKTDAMILAGIILSGSFSGVMTFILFYLLEWAFQYLNKEAIKKKLPLALISLAVFLVGVVIAFPYISTRLGDLGTEGSSSYYRIVGPLVMVGYSLTHIDGVVRFGSLYEYVASFGIFNGADVGKTIDNGLYLLIIYFSWFAVFLSLWYMGKVIKMMINAFGDNRNFRVQLYLFTPVSLFFTGSIFSPEYAFLIVCPFILRKALNITR